ncbi:hypothetical protein QBC43DRAFT_337626 [Cladorrhinum sp. PSN259]|nr:hypothetical protein QBC43DRAFT_337626 [Cladorrhinum sp. PSN259]
MTFNPYYKGYTAPLNPPRDSTTLSPYGPFSSASASAIQAKRSTAFDRPGRRLDSYNFRDAYRSSSSSSSSLEPRRYSTHLSPRSTTSFRDSDEWYTTTHAYYPAGPTPRNQASTQLEIFLGSTALDSTVLGIIAMVFPPFVVYLRTGWHWAFVLNVLFCFFELWPGVLHAFWVMLEYPPRDLRERNWRVVGFAAVAAAVLWSFGFKETVQLWKNYTARWVLVRAVWTAVWPWVKWVSAVMYWVKDRLGYD